jgi:predicted Holliday junction resolvase-like endonuclease
MASKKEIKEIIQSLNGNNFHATCPNCYDEFKLKDAGLFHLDNFTPEALDLYKAMQEGLKERRADLKEEKAKIPLRSETGAKAVNIGFVLERIAPTLDGFTFEQNDCRAMFDPIDYVIFEGLSSKGKVNKIIMVDIKTGGARLNPKQRRIKELVEDKKMEFRTYKR